MLKPNVDLEILPLLCGPPPPSFTHTTLQWKKLSIEDNNYTKQTKKNCTQLCVGTADSVLIREVSLSHVVSHTYQTMGGLN